ncbi:Ubiquitin-conjugating BIR-domain enzyme apollon [Heterostelium album PN500]|uniref:Ubiquitin-conjugating BIR-domain enzyme apollon n=1 Tax=Heterostelium pallidum (strain ATCC 26659 / Pp 5 / PN500) TaxID=670386 RepID=D3B813_HETP5|nr:Ubiquitin-conjugating BIR-domain enzyme apollon [Heterostelium album PN500]EFA82181.1 Ubiquitin-conjugating BIR-domain enzyme apollon [Heterostelium album PN500]|eukprot:XP_020434298.1 Ubiquitin-conjugating BIR-domain enzyme apollon [Heterostelium album PN500]
MAGHLEKQFEQWANSSEEPDEYVWLQSTKNTIEMLFKGFEINITFPLDLSDIKSYKLISKEKSCEVWINRLNTDLPNLKPATFKDLLDLSLKYFKNRNASHTSGSSDVKMSDTDVDIEDEGEEEGNDEDDHKEDNMEEDEEVEDEEFASGSAEDEFDDEDDLFENDHFQEALQTLKMKKEWAKKEQLIRAQLGEKKKKDPKVNSIFSSDAAFGVLTNDLFSIMKNVHTLGFSAQPIDDNIYFWSVKMFGFDPESKIYQQLQLLKKEFDYVLFTEDLYPFYPPTLKIIRPRLQGFLIGKISHLEILTLENWNPINDMRMVLNHLKEVLEKFGHLDVNNPLNSLQSTGSYSSTEHFLLRLEILSNIVPRANQKYGLVSNIVKPAVVISKPKQLGDKAFWAKGTGYGRGAQNGWNVDAYVAAQKERDQETISLINAIEKEIKIKPPPFDVLEESCLLPFFESYCRDIVPLDIERHQDLFQAIFSLMDTISNHEQFIPLFSLLAFQTNSLGELLNSASLQIESVFRVLDEAQKKALVAQNLIITVNKKVQTKLKSMMEEIKKLEVGRGITSEPIDTSVELKYVKMLKPHLFDAASFTSTSSGHNSQARILRIAQEQGGLISSLPISFDSTVFVRVDEKNIDSMQALITGPADTPYSAGCFLFQISFPAAYPQSPPHVVLSTTGEGTVRFNPNLYNNGKVCLSLLGTWSGGAGENWNPNTSTLLQVLVSIQSLILVPEPFFNEPGYETQIGSQQGKTSSMNYNQNIRIATIEWAMTDMIRKCPAHWKDIVHAHFWFQKQKIKAQCDKWLEEFLNFKTINSSLNSPLRSIESTPISTSSPLLIKTNIESPVPILDIKDSNRDSVDSIQPNGEKENESLILNDTIKVVEVRKIVWVHYSSISLKIQYNDNTHSNYSDFYLEIVRLFNLIPNATIEFRINSISGPTVGMMDSITNDMKDIYIVEPPVVEEFQQGVSIETISRRFNLENISLKRKGSNTIVAPPLLSGDYIVEPAPQVKSNIQDISIQHELDIIEKRKDINGSRKRALKLLLNVMSMMSTAKTMATLLPKTLYDLIK